MQVAPARLTTNDTRSYWPAASPLGLRRFSRLIRARHSTRSPNRRAVHATKRWAVLPKPQIMKAFSNGGLGTVGALCRKQHTKKARSEARADKTPRGGWGSGAGAPSGRRFAWEVQLTTTPPGARSGARSGSAFRRRAWSRCPSSRGTLLNPPNMRHVGGECKQVGNNHLSNPRKEKNIKLCRLRIALTLLFFGFSVGLGAGRPGAGARSRCDRGVCVGCMVGSLRHW